MASINETGRSRPSSTAASIETSKTDKAHVKEKNRFGGLQKRKGEIDKTSHASRALNREQTRINKSAPQRAKGLEGYKDRGARGGAVAAQGVKQSASGKPARVNTPAQRTSQQTTQQPTQAAAQQAPPQKPARVNTPPQQPTQVAAQQAPPPKPARSTPAQPQQAEQPAVARQAPRKPDRSAASLRGQRAPAQQVPQSQGAGSPRTLPRTIMNVPTPAPRAAPQAAPRSTVSHKAVSSHDTIKNTPRPALRSPGSEKFLAEGGFNPASTLVRNRPAGAPIPGSGSGDRPILADRRANAPLPAPPRMSVGTRFLSLLKNIFTFGGYGRAVASRANSGRVGITLTEDAMIFASDAHKHLRRSVTELESPAIKSKLTAKEQDTYRAAQGVILASLKATGENVLPDNHYHPDAESKIASGLAALDKIIYEHTGVAYKAPYYDETRPPDFPSERTAVSGFSADDRIYETLDQAQGGQTGAGSGRGTGGAENI